MRWRWWSLEASCGVLAGSRWELFCEGPRAWFWTVDGRAWMRVRPGDA